MTGQCPRCGAMITYFAADVDTTMACRACGEPVKVTPDGLTKAILPASAPPMVVAAPAGRAGRAPAVSSPNPAGEVDLFPWLLGCLFLPGLFLTLLFAMLPAIDRAGLASFDADAVDADVPAAKARQEMERKKEEKREELRKKERNLQYKRDEISTKRIDLDRRASQVYSKNPPVPAEVDALRKAQDALAKEDNALFKEEDQLRDQRNKLENELKVEYRDDLEKLEKLDKERAQQRDKLDLDRRTTEARVLRRAYWYYWVLLGGLLVLTVGAVGYLTGRQSVVQRVVGAVVLGAIVLLVVAKLNSGRGVLMGMLGGGSDKSAVAYNLTTPQGALLSAKEMILNNDLHALVELQEGRDRLEKELHFAREELDTLEVHREARWNDTMVLFVTYLKNAQRVYKTEGVRRDARAGIWRPTFVYYDNVRGTDPMLAKAMEEWNHKGDATRPVPPDIKK